MSKTYCTYVTFYSGNKLPPFYIGSTSVDKIEKGYRGSVKSKRWKQIYESEIKTNPQLFRSEIIETFSERQSALNHELELQRSNDVVKSHWFFNESFAMVNGFFGRRVYGKDHFLTGKGGVNHPLTGRKRPHHSEIMSGRKDTDITRSRKSIAAKGKHHGNGPGKTPERCMKDLPKYIQTYKLYQSRPQLKSVHNCKGRNGKNISYEHAFSIEFANIIGLSPGSIRGIITGSSETICNEIQQSFSKYE